MIDNSDKMKYIVISILIATGIWFYVNQNRFIKKESCEIDCDTGVQFEPTCGTIKHGGKMGEEVYLDRYQCQRYDVDYFEESSFSIEASKLLESKDYDVHHHNILEPLGHVTITLERERESRPGWYRIRTWKS